MIVLFCPSRGRPKDASELLSSFTATRRSDSRLVFLVDEDDPTAGEYPGEVVVGPSSGDPVTPLNRAALASDADVMGYIGDDSRMETEGWDVKVQRALDEVGGGFVWGWDGHLKPWPSTYFVSKNIVRAIGYLALPTTRRGYFDLALVQLASRTGTAIALRDVVIPHHNEDRSVAPDIIERDRIAYEAWLQDGIRRDAERVRQSLLSPVG